MLTNAAAKAARPRAAAFKLFDQGGLHLYAPPTPTQYHPALLEIKDAGAYSEISNSR